MSSFGRFCVLLFNIWLISNEQYTVFGGHEACDTIEAAIAHISRTIEPGEGLHPAMPQGPDGGPLDVGVQFWIQDIPDVHFSGPEAAANGPGTDAFIFVSEYWTDARLAHDPPCRDRVTLPPYLIGNMWSPDLSFVNGFGAEVVKSPRKNNFMLVYPNGTVWNNYRMRVRGPCTIDASKYPLDVGNCSFIVESYTYSADQMNLHWRTSTPVLVLKDIEGVLNVNATRSEQHYPAGRWYELTLDLGYARPILVTCASKNRRKVVPYSAQMTAPGGACEAWEKVGRYGPYHVCENCKWFDSKEN